MDKMVEVTMRQSTTGLKNNLREYFKCACAQALKNEGSLLPTPPSRCFFNQNQ